MKYVKYRTQKQQVSYDGGETWEDTGEVRKGEYIGVYDTAEDCANAIVPPHDAPLPQANPGAKATYILDDGTEADIPFVGYRGDADQSSASTRFTDDYAFTIFDTGMSFIDWSYERKTYVGQHVVKIIISSAVTCICGYIRLTPNPGVSVSDCPKGTPYPSGCLTFRPGYSNCADPYQRWYNNLQEIVIPDTVGYIGMRGVETQVSKMNIPANLRNLKLDGFKYLNKEFVIPESYTGGSECNWSSYSYDSINADVPVFVSYSNSCIPDKTTDSSACRYADNVWELLLYNNIVPSTANTYFPQLVYVRDELVGTWLTAWRNSANQGSGACQQHNNRLWINPFFPLSYYNTDFRNPNDNEKFVARLSNGTLYSIPLGDGVVTSGDVETIKTMICDIKFGPGVTKINRGVFGYSNLVDSSRPRHTINLVEINSDADVSNCDVKAGINKIKVNGNNFFNFFSTIYRSSPSTGALVPGTYYYVPDDAFEAYVKSIPLRIKLPGFDDVGSSSRLNVVRSKIRPMSSFKINLL